VRRIALLCLFVLGLSGSSASAQTRVSLLAVGDFGVGGTTELTTGWAMDDFEAWHSANLLILLGDNDYSRTPARFRANWRRSFGWAHTWGVGVAGVLGNHDVEVAGGRYELALLGMPRAYYTRTIGDVQFFFLNSNSVDDRQTAWLERQLSNSTATWKVAVFHHPAYTCGGHSGDADVVARWVPLFEDNGVQLVLSGHDHNYQRFAPQNGVTYVVNGGGGAGLYALRSCPSSYPTRVRARYQHGFLYFTAGAARMDGYAVDSRGRITDHFSLRP